MPSQITLQNTDGTTWTSGKRGKPPLWVQSHPDYLEFKAGKFIDFPDTPVAEVTDTALKYWKWIGLENFEAQHQCYVAASSREDAMRELNKTFKSHPVGSAEMDRMWSPIQPEEGMVQAVGAYELKEKSWTKR